MKIRNLKNLVIPFTFCLLTVVLAAQPEESKDAKATAILQSLDKKTKSYKTIYAEFTITQYGSDKNVSDSQKGIIWVKGPDYKFDIKNQTIYCDSSTTWTYLKDANEVQINNVDSSGEKGNLSPANIFSFYEKGFKSHFVDEETVNTVLCDCVDLYPKHPEKEKFHTLTLYIDKAKEQVVQVIAKLKDGTTLIYSVNKFTPNIALQDSTFVFDAKKFPGVEIEDLRE